MVEAAEMAANRSFRRIKSETAYARQATHGLHACYFRQKKPAHVQGHGPAKHYRVVGESPGIEPG
ncbi:hypothetical protein D9M68_1008870 [compost metagenome]